MPRPRAAAVVVDGDRVLVIKRHRNGRDYAVLPGGGIEAGETAEQAVLRELWEETTLTAEVDRLLWTGRHDDRPAWYFLMTAVRGAPTLSGPEAVANRPDNSFELVWATADRFDELALHPPYLRTRLAELLAGHRPDPREPAAAGAVRAEPVNGVRVDLDQVRTIVFTGDSVTDCGRRVGPPGGLGRGYVRMVADAVAAGPHPAPRLVNSGTAGDRLTDLEHRWSTDVLAHRPDLLSVLIGVNDTWRRHDRGLDSPLDEFEVRYDRMLAAAAAAGTRLVLVEPFLLPVDDAQRGWRADLDLRIAVVHRLAQRYAAVLVPADRALASTAADVGPAALAADGVHPTEQGHRVLADAWLDAVLSRRG